LVVSEDQAVPLAKSLSVPVSVPCASSVVVAPPPTGRPAAASVVLPTSCSDVVLVSVVLSVG